MQFSDVKFTKDNIVESVDSLFNATNYTSYGATGSVVDYFKDNLLKEDVFSFDVAKKIVTLSQKSFYGEDRNLSTDVWISEMVEEACRIANRQGVDFSQYDGDNNGEVDNVFIIFAGTNQSESGNIDDIRPQIGNISFKNCTLNGKRIGDFGCYSEYSGSDQEIFAGPGTICHECLHLLGLLDFYDVNGETEGLSDGLFGITSIMDYGNYNNNGKTPPYLNAIERELLGQLEIEEISLGNHYELDPIWKSNKAFRLNTANENEYFLLEYRDGYKWDKHIGGTGLLIYHIDKSSQYAGNLQANIRWSIAAINCSAEHPCATIFDALGNGKVEELFYPLATKDVFSNRTNDLVSWNGVGTGVGLTNIHITGDNKIAFDVIEDLGWELPKVEYCKVNISPIDIRLDWVSDKEYHKDAWKIDYGIVGKGKISSIQVEGKTALLTNLTPGETYWCEIYMEDGKYIGDKYKFEIKNVFQGGNYPLIADMHGSFSVGSLITLQIINLTEPLVSERWYVNGKEYFRKHYLFETPGDVTIKVVYSTDGKKYYELEKKVTVQ